ncbi:MAG: RHS repeat-associated core domain-containing protein [Bacteroidales bacterium]|jgi:RHS repeat-associated protein|nr:RHS repeat-associated core domain-containing protein [Bacteroidales bacterium]
MMDTIPRYLFNAKELDEESGMYYYEARYHDPKSGTFISRDVYFEKQPFMSPYAYCNNNPINLVDPDGRQAQPTTVRIMFYGGSRKDDNTFLNAANNVSKSYGGTTQKVQIQNAQTIIKYLNKQKANSVKSLDIFSHSGNKQLYFKRGLATNDLYLDSKADHGWFGNSGSLDNINMNVFTNDARVEIHGCNAASIEGNDNYNFASAFSKKLYEAGKTDAVTIGHVTAGNPDNHTELGGDDYRHGGRRVYHNGEVLFFTRKEGHISNKTIQKYLDLKKEQGDSYDGSTQRY